MAGAKKYPDLRFLFMRGLINHERDQRCHHYLKSAAECTSRAVVSLELADEPIRSVKQARKLEGIGGETCSRLTKLEKEKEFSCLRPLGGRFVSSAGGILVALLDATEEARHKDNCSPDKVILVPEDKVKSRAIRLTEEQFTDGTNEFCKAWWRLEVLIKRGYIRRRSQKKSPVLQLMPLGKDIALRLRAQTGLTTTVPDINQVSDSSCSVPRLPSLCKPGEISQTATGEANAQYPKPELEDALYTNDDGKDGVVLLVDRRELGGEKNGLGELCGLLGNRGICYKTQHLKTGDYSWMWRVNNKQIILPCLVERKRADDIVRTLMEGRFWTQVNKMKEWKQDFTRKGIQCAVHYILERKPEEYVVKCEDGCQGIVKCGNPTLTQVKMVIEDLKKHPDLLVKETDNLNITVILLASLTAELKERVKKGDFDELLKLEDSKKKSQSCQTKTSPDEINNVWNKPSASKVKSTTNSLSSDLRFDEDLRLAIEMSRAEKNKIDKILENLNSSKKTQHGHLNVSRTKAKHTSSKGSKESNKVESDCVVIDDDSNDVVEVGNVIVVDDDDDDVDDDADDDDVDDDELALVLERSKYDTYNKTEGVADVAKGGAIPKTRPLMQYHCSEGGSLNYPTPSRTARENHAATYRPKINQRQSVHSVDSPKQGSHDAVSQPLTSVPCNKGSSDMFRSSNCTTDVNESVKSLQIQNTYPGIDNESNKTIDLLNESHTEENTKLVKRKQRKKDFVFQPDEHCIEESSVNDSELIPKKKPRTSDFNFTPSRDCIEINVVQTSVNKDNKKRCKRNAGGKLCKVSKSRKRENKAFNKVVAESDMGDSLNMEHTDGIEGLDVSENARKVVERLENDNSNGYCSEEDIFADTDSTNDNQTVTSVEERDNEERNNEICSGNVDNSGQNGELSLSRGSDSQDSLPDIDLNIATPVKYTSDTGNSKIVKSSPQILSQVGYTCSAGCSNTNKNKMNYDGYKNIDRESDRSGFSSGQERIDSGYDSDTLNVNNSEIENKVELVMSVLPHIGRNSISKMLKSCGNNVELCVTQFLEGNDEM